MQILIADDDPTAREMARQILARAGHQVDAAASGLDALAALLARSYDLALLDLQMPQLDGAAVARAARAALAARCPRILAFSAGVDPGVEAALRARGFDGCLPKPIRAAALVAALGPALGPPPPAAPADPPLPPLAAGPARAILADPAAAPAALAAAAATLKLAALAAERPALAGLCARLERAVPAGDPAARAELARAIVAMLAG